MEKHADFLIPELRGQEAKDWATPMLQQQELTRCVQMVVPDGQHADSLFQNCLEERLAVDIRGLAEVLQKIAPDARILGRDGIIQGCGEIGSRP